MKKKGRGTEGKRKKMLKGKNTKSFVFEPPSIIGVISDRTVQPSFLKKLGACVKRRHLNYVCLPFRVEQKYLKNVVACMRLMDIKVLVVSGKHTKRIGRFLGRLHRSAKDEGLVNVIRRQNNQFTGYFFEDGQGLYPQIVNFLTI